MKKLSVILAVVMMFAGVFTLSACSNKNPEAASYVAMDINPSIELVLDKNDKVIAVNAANEDAEVMLYGAKGILNCKISDASRVIAELAVKYSYVDEDSVNINVTVSGENQNKENEIFASVDASFKKVFDKNDIRAAVEKASGFAAQIRLERAKQAYPDSSAVQSLSVGKFRLAEAAVRADRSLSFEKAAEMSVEELSKVLYDCECYRLEVASREFAEAYAKAKAELSNAREALLDTAYLAADSAQVKIKAAEYVAVRNTSRAMKYLRDVEIDLEPVLTDEQIEEIAAKLGKDINEFKAEIEKYGEATAQNIEYCLDRAYEKMTDAEKQAVKDVYKEAVEFAEASKQALKVFGNSLKDEITAQVEIVAAYAGIDLDELREIDSIEELQNYVITKLDKRAADLEQWFDENLTSQEKQQVENARKKMNEALDKLEQQFEKTMQQAETRARERIEQRQQKRLGIS